MKTIDVENRTLASSRGNLFGSGIVSKHRYPISVGCFLGYVGMGDEASAGEGAGIRTAADLGTRSVLFSGDCEAFFGGQQKRIYEEGIYTIFAFGHSLIKLDVLLSQL